MTTRGTQRRSSAFKGNAPEAIFFRAKLARNISLQCGKRGMQVTELAKKSGVAYAKLVASLETTSATTLIDCARLARTLEVSVDTLLDGCMDGPRGAE